MESLPQKVLKFRLEKETKGALRYMEVDANGARQDIGNGATIGTIYVRKDHVDGTPKSLSVTLTVED